MDNQGSIRSRNAYLQTFRLERHRTEIIILRLHIKRIFCQAWFQSYPPCNHAGFKEKPTGRVAQSCAKRIVQLMLPKPSKITHNFHLTRCALQHGHLALNQKQNWLVSGAYLQTFRLERHRNHHLETSYQVHLLSSLVSILPALQPCWVQGKTHRACCPVMCQKNRATHAAQAIKNNAQLRSDKMCSAAWTSSAQSEAELACIWCLSSDIQTGAAQKSSSRGFISSASSVKLIS